MSQTIYLDNAATTPLSEQVLEEMMPYLKDSYGNPSSVYDLGVANKSALLTARKRIAKTLNCANLIICSHNGYQNGIFTQCLQQFLRFYKPLFIHI